MGLHSPFLWIFVLFLSFVNCQNYYVSNNSTNIFECSINNPCGSIQNAIETACSNTTTSNNITIWVQNGIYEQETIKILCPLSIM